MAVAKKNKHTFTAPQGKVKKATMPTATATRRSVSLHLLSVRPEWWWVAGFVLLWVGCYCLLGDFLMRLEQDSFVTADARSMKFLTDTPFGYVFWAMRYLLLPFKLPLLGTTLYALLLTLLAMAVRRTFNLSSRLWALSFLPSWGLLIWMAWRGINLYYKAEPSLFMTLTIGLLLIFGIGAGVQCFRHRQQKEAAEAHSPFWTDLLPVVGLGLLFYTTHFYRQNDLLTAKLQLQMMRGEWQEMVELARTAKRPSKAVAAYHAVGLTMQRQILEGMFELRYDFPESTLDERDGNEVYGVFESDCNLVAGLVDGAYHTAFDRLVMNGTKLRILKLLTICAVLNEEKALAKKYLRIIGSTPFEEDFVEHWTPLAENPKAIEEDENLRLIRELRPLETEAFEQFYRTPLFLGYNYAMMKGAKVALGTALAACLYTKDLSATMPRIQQYVATYQSLPRCLQETLVLVHFTNPRANLLAQVQPLLGPTTVMEFQQFISEFKAQPTKDNARIREALKERWGGTYYYYYYCENNDPEQTKAQQSDGVN